MILGPGAVNLPVLPSGTGLGAYAFWVLLTHRRQLFDLAGVPHSGSAIR